MANNNVLLYDLKGHTETITTSSDFWGLTYDRDRRYDEFSVPTLIFDKQGISVSSKAGDVISVNGVFITPTAYFSGQNVLFYNQALNHTWEHDSRGFSVSLGGIPIMSSHAHSPSYQPSDPMVEDGMELMKSNSMSEAAVNTMTTGISAYNTYNSIQSALSNGNLSSVLMGRYGLSPTVTLGMRIAHSRQDYQTLTNSGIYVSDLHINAQNRAVLEGVNVVASHDVDVDAKDFEQCGEALRSKATSQTANISVGVSAEGVDQVSLSASSAAQESTTFVNEQMQVGNKLTVNAENWTLDGANVEAGTLEAHVTDTFTEKTERGHSASQRYSGSVSTIGSFSLSEAHQQSDTINQATGIHTTGRTDIDADTVNLEGAKITSDGVVYVKANTLQAESVEERSSGHTYGVSANVHSLFGDSKQSRGQSNRIETATVKAGGSRYSATQDSVIYGEKGTDIDVQHRDGVLDQENRDGHITHENSHYNYNADIPTGFEKGTSEEPQTAQIELSHTPDDTHTQGGDEVVSTSQGTDSSHHSSQGQHDMSTHNASVHSDVQLDPKVFDTINTVTETMQNTSVDITPFEGESEGPEILYEESNNDIAEPEYPTVLPTTSQDGHAWEREGRVLLYDVNGVTGQYNGKTGSITDQDDAALSNGSALNTYLGVMRGMSGASDFARAWMNDPIGASNAVLTNAGEFLYDQVNEAEYVLTGGYLGDSDSIARNELRAETIVNYFSALANSQFGSEERGYLVGEGLSWFLPGVDFTKLSDVTLDLGRASLLADGGLFSSPFVGGVVAESSAQAAIRSRVLSNIAESKAAREATGFPVLSAKINQISGGYLPDTWEMTTLHKGDIIYGGLPGQSNYYTNIDSALASEGDNAALGRILQVEPHPIRGYRPNIGEYVVTKDIRVPGGVIRANPTLGPGGMQQYFVNDYSNALNLNNDYGLEEFYDSQLSPSGFRP